MSDAHLDERLKPAAPTPMERFVVVGTLGDVPAGVDLLVVEPGVPERRVLRRLFSNVGARRFVLERLREEQSSTRPPRVLEVGEDKEKRVCVLLEDAPRMPWELARPRNASEAALLAYDILRSIPERSVVRDYARGTIAFETVYMDLHGQPQLRTFWPPRSSPEGIGPRVVGPEALVADVEELIRRWGFGPIPLIDPTFRNLEEVLRRMVPHVRPPRWSPPLLADARRLLDVLTDADQKQDERIQAAYRLATVPSLFEETGALLVRALNEPLDRLPFVARDLLADRMVPQALFVDRASGLLRRCPHEWAGTEIVHELGGTGVERFCPDCDARVTLPQTIEAFEGRSAVADAFAARAS